MRDDSACPSPVGGYMGLRTKVRGMDPVSWLRSPPVQTEFIYLLSLMRIGESPGTHRSHTDEHLSAFSN